MCAWGRGRAVRVRYSLVGFKLPPLNEAVESHDASWLNMTCPLSHILFMVNHRHILVLMLVQMHFTLSKGKKNKPVLIFFSDPKCAILFFKNPRLFPE